MIERDFADMGLDLGDDNLTERRSWRWFETRVIGLLDRPVVAYVQTVDPTDSTRTINEPLFSSRLQAHFAPGV